MAQTSSTRSRTWIWLVPTLLLAAGLLYFALSNSRDRMVVTTAHVERGSLQKEIPTNGRVEPLVDFQAHAPAPSTVEQLNVHLGEEITRGQLLLTLDASDAAARVATARSALAAAQQGVQNESNGGTHDELLAERADLQNAQTQYRDASASLTNLKALQAQGAASANEVAAAQQRVSDAQARINQLQTRLHGRYDSGDLTAARAQVAQAQQQLAAAESDLAAVQVHSLITGTVYFLPIARFDYVTAGEALVSVADLHKLQVRAFFDQDEVGDLAPGQPVKIVWAAKLDRAWHGHVAQVPTTITNVGTRSVGECLISVDDAQGDLLPNTNVTATVTVSQRSGVLTIPREALRTDGAENFVYSIVGGKLARTPVSVAVVSLTRVEITNGLKDGDVVVVGATTDADLKAGVPVRTEP